MKIAYAFFCIIFFCTPSFAQPYHPPKKDKAIFNMTKIDFSKSQADFEPYRLQFKKCDQSDVFAGIKVTGNHSCKRDVSNVSAILKLEDGAIFWQSKMALDVDGSPAAWNGFSGSTDSKCTSFMWEKVHCKENSSDENVRKAQLNPDLFPYIVIPGIPKENNEQFNQLNRPNLIPGDMGVVIYEDRWVPVLIGDVGPFNKIGEASSRVFEEIGHNRCKRWNADKTECIGQNIAIKDSACSERPQHLADIKEGAYCDYGLSDYNAIYIAYPDTKDATMTPQNAHQKLCEFAKNRLNLTNSSYCQGLPNN